MNMRKKLLLVVVLMTTLWGKTFACGWDDGDWYYYNLFSQEIMKDPRYRPFLLIYGSRYYTNDTLRNGNIEEWQQYLGLSYDDTQYLVFKSSREDLQNLTKGKPVADKRLAFATPEFAQKHKQALLYLAYAKYLEPYMRIVPGEDSDEFSYWYFDDPYEHNAGELDYDKVKTVLTRSWNAETDNELKLRYGYQLVRLAHYTRRFEEAVQLFNQYVEPLNYRPEMYYYALSQKAGALRGMGETEKANRDYVRVFANSYDLKTMVYTSLTMGWDNDINFADFVAGAADDNERKDIYFMMGYSDFNNPVNEIAKIVAIDPDAIQAKVLMVRAVNLIERSMLPSYLPWPVNGKTMRYPSLDPNDVDGIAFFNQALKVSDSQRANASDKNFWNLVSSYLHFLNQDFDQAGEYLAKVKSKDDLYMTMVNNLTAFVDICRQPVIDAKTEKYLFDKYEDLITSPMQSFNYADNTFIRLVLANRYELQGEEAKSFLTLHGLNEIENDPDEMLLDKLQSFLNKRNKTPLEEYIAATDTRDLQSTNNYIAYVKGVLRLTEGDFDAAKPLFDQQTRLRESRRIFGNNIMVYYSGEEKKVMRDDYIQEFPFIHDNMTEADVTEALIQLKKIGDKKDGNYSAKANYLISNFFYNVSVTGYYRHYLRFDKNNGYCDVKFNPVYSPYANTSQLAMAYLRKAMITASDNELKAHIAFAAAKIDQQDGTDCSYAQGDDYFYDIIYTPNRFKEFERYQGTDYYDDVMSNCWYFYAYHNGLY